jgi:hypothetical protein
VAGIASLSVIASRTLSEPGRRSGRVIVHLCLKIVISASYGSDIVRRYEGYRGNMVDANHQCLYLARRVLSHWSGPVASDRAFVSLAIEAERRPAPPGSAFPRARHPGEGPWVLRRMAPHLRLILGGGAREPRTGPGPGRSRFATAITPTARGACSPDHRGPGRRSPGHLLPRTGCAPTSRARSSGPLPSISIRPRRMTIATVREPQGVRRRERHMA